MTIATPDTRLENLSVNDLCLEDLAFIFISRIQNIGTRKRYGSCLKKIFVSNILNSNAYYSDILRINVNQCLDNIFSKIDCSRSTQQVCAAAFISFFKFLNRVSKGTISVPITQKLGIFKTFMKVRKKSVFPSLSKEEIRKVISFSYEISYRLGLFVEMSLQSAKRIGEILNAKVENINWSSLYITFKVSKVEGEKESIISFPNHFFCKLRYFIGERTSGFIFQTKSGKRVQSDYIWRQFNSISRRANIGKKLSPHTLRATSITLYRSYGFSFDEIVDITGHSSVEMVKYYDKSDLINNPSNKISLI